MGCPCDWGSGVFATVPRTVLADCAALGCGAPVVRQLPVGPAPEFIARCREGLQLLDVELCQEQLVMLNAAAARAEWLEVVAGDFGLTAGQCVHCIDSALGEQAMVVPSATG